MLENILVDYTILRELFQRFIDCEENVLPHVMAIFGLVRLINNVLEA